MSKTTNAQETLIASIKVFISKNRCSLPEDEVIKLEDCIQQFEDFDNCSTSAVDRSTLLKLLSKAIGVIAKYLLFKEIHDFFDC